jgi:hypothetical protein
MTRDQRDTMWEILTLALCLVTCFLLGRSCA